MTTPIPARRRRFALISAVLIVAVVELASYAAARILAARALIYTPPPLDEIDDYIARRDPELGWLAIIDASQAAEVDAAGARRSTAFPQPAASCVSLYGDSFVWSDEVGPEQAWSEVLARSLGCRVANYGVNGYGSDQAFMRFEGQVADESEVVVLAHLSENVLRNVNRFRRLIYPSAKYTLKPRYVLEDGTLTRVAMPLPDHEELAALVTSPAAHLDHEFFAPGGASGMQTLSFPYTVALARTLSHYHLRARLAGVPRYAELYEPDHPSGALALTTAIFVEFERTARARGKVPVSVILSSRESLEHYEVSGRHFHQPLIDSLRASGVDVLDAAGPMLEVMGNSGESVADVFAVNHLNERGAAVLAGVVEAELVARELSPGATRD